MCWMWRRWWVGVRWITDARSTWRGIGCTWWRSRWDNVWIRVRYMRCMCVLGWWNFVGRFIWVWMWWCCWIWWRWFLSVRIAGARCGRRGRTGRLNWRVWWERLKKVCSGDMMNLSVNLSFWRCSLWRWWRYWCCCMGRWRSGRWRESDIFKIRAAAVVVVVGGEVVLYLMCILRRLNLLLNLGLWWRNNRSRLRLML